MKHAFLAATLVLASTSVLADHNSPNGAGWANMPNDIHNTRIEEDLSGREFADFVRQGAGAATVNRYLDSSTATRGSRAAAPSGNGGRR
jgi:hypothetical protein